jgi:hypothetical protein
MASPPARSDSRKRRVGSVNIRGLGTMMRNRVAGTTAATVLMVCAAGATDTDIRAFIGTWKENPAKSRHFISSALTYTFTREPDGFVSIVRGNTPLHDRARIDGKDYPTPGVPGRVISWSQVSDTVLESAVKRDGALIASTRWTLSDSGRHLTQQTIPVRANDDNDINIIEYVRAAGDGNTLLGEWKPTSSRSAVPDLFVMTLVDDELQAFYPKYGFIVYTMRLDAKRYPLSAPNALPGASSMTERLGPRTVRRITYVNEKPTLEATMSVSADSQTMTVTTRNPNSSGSDEPSIAVYERQH